MVADQKEMGARSIKLMDEYNSQKSLSWFQVSSKFYVRTSVKFTFANKIAGSGRSNFSAGWKFIRCRMKIT